MPRKSKSKRSVRHDSAVKFILETTACIAKHPQRFTENQKNRAALEQATAIRMKERAKFQAQEKDMLATIQACKQAVAILSKHHPSLLEIKKAVSGVVKTSNSISTEKIMDKMQALKKAMDGLSSEGFLQQAPAFQSYGSQSGQIFGMLKQMAEQFETDLAAEVKKEQSSVKAFKELKKATRAQIKAGEEQFANISEQLAETKDRHAGALEDLSKAEDILADANEFMGKLNEKCDSIDEHYATRTKSRNEEIEAVAETIKILNDDAAFDVMGKALGFVQVRSSSMSELKKRELKQVVAVLEKVAPDSPQIALIQTFAKLNAFTKVKECTFF